MENEVVNEAVVTEQPIAEEVVETTEPVSQVKAGDKTEPNLLLASLQEEREKRRLLEEELSALKANSNTDEVFSDEGRLLQQKIASLEEKIEMKELIEKNPALKDKSNEFNEFKRQYPGVSVDKLAKLFLSENDLTESVQPRKGLEKASGGGRVQPKEGMTADDVSNLRNTNFRKYMQLVKEGKIVV